MTSEQQKRSETWDAVSRQAGTAEELASGLFASAIVVGSGATAGLRTRLDALSQLIELTGEVTGSR